MDTMGAKVVAYWNSSILGKFYDISWLVDALSNFRFSDLCDILIVAYLIYYVYRQLVHSHADIVVKGIITLAIFYVLSDSLGLYTVQWLLSQSAKVMLFAIPVLFKEQLLEVLSRLGSRFGSFAFVGMEERQEQNVIECIIKACQYMSNHHVGALMIFERKNDVTLSMIKQGVTIDAQVSEELVRNLFFINSPLHDGAVVVKNGRIRQAGAILPLTNKRDLNQELGTRHRAAIGITEHTDALGLVVSEETGIISVTCEGAIHRNMTADDLRLWLTPAHEDVNKGLKDLAKRQLQKIREHMRQKFGLKGGKEQ